MVAQFCERSLLCVNVFQITLKISVITVTADDMSVDKRQNVLYSRSTKPVDRWMSLLGLKEGTCGLAPLSMTRYLFFCPEGIQIKGHFPL